MTTHQAALVDSQGRIANIVDEFNGKVQRFDPQAAELDLRTTLACSKTNDLDARLKKLTDDVNNLAAASQTALTLMQDVVITVKPSQTSPI